MWSQLFFTDIKRRNEKTANLTVTNFDQKLKCEFPETENEILPPKMLS